MRHIYVLGALAGSMLSCATGETEKDYTATPVVATEKEAGESVLVINEFSPKSRELNEFGEEADWLELYNRSGQDLVVKAGEWSLSDDAGNPTKYELPDTIIPARGHLMIWCDEQKSDTGILHANFKLAGNGETLYLFHQSETADEITYDDDIKKTCSFGREKDGADTWEKFKTPTPGISNTLLENYAEAL